MQPKLTANQEEAFEEKIRQLEEEYDQGIDGGKVFDDMKDLRKKITNLLLELAQRRAGNTGEKAVH